MTALSIYAHRAIFLLTFLLLSSITAQGKYVSQYVNIDCSKKDVGLSETETEKAWLSYIRLSEGNWIHYSFSDASGEYQNLIASNSKELCKALNLFLISKGIESDRITMKYSPIASLIVYKESGKKIAANYVDRDPKAVQLFTIKNGSGGSCLTKAGNKIDFPADAFRCAKSAKVEIAVHEMMTKSDFVRTGYTSTSDDRTLESRGMYHIKATTEGKEVKLRPGKSAQIKFAENNFPNKNEASMFNTFYGNEKNGVVNWKISNHEKTRANLLSNDIPMAKNERKTGGTRLHRKMTYTEISYVQLCKKIHLINTSISKNMKRCKLDKKNYLALVKEHGKLNKLVKGNPIDINSFKEYQVISAQDPNSILLALNQEQKGNYDKNAAEEQKIRIAAAEERRKKFEEQQAKIREEREARAALEKKNFPVSMKISQLGNINCDRFNNSSKKTDVIVQLDDYDYEQIRVYAVFNKIQSVINGYYRKEHKGMIKFEKLPRGKDVTYIAATFKGDEVKLAYLSKKIEEDDHIKLSLNTYSKENYERILDDLIPN